MSLSCKSMNWVFLQCFLTIKVSRKIEVHCCIHRKLEWRQGQLLWYFGWSDDDIQTQREFFLPLICREVFQQPTCPLVLYILLKTFQELCNKEFQFGSTFPLKHLFFWIFWKFRSQWVLSPWYWGRRGCFQAWCPCGLCLPDGDSLELTSAGTWCSWCHPQTWK